MNSTAAAGNMWGQQWQEIIDIVAPYPEEPEFDVTNEMKEQKWDCRKIFNAADSFFQSIGKNTEESDTKLTLMCIGLF